MIRGKILILIFFLSEILEDNEFSHSLKSLLLLFYIFKRQFPSGMALVD